MSDRLRLQLLFEARIPVRLRRGVCQQEYVLNSVASGIDEVVAIQNWVDHVVELIC